MCVHTQAAREWACVTLRVVPRGVRGRSTGRRVAEGVRLGGLAARPHEQLHAHRRADVRAQVRRHAAHQVRLRRGGGEVINTIIIYIPSSWQQCIKNLEEFVNFDFRSTELL